MNQRRLNKIKASVRRQRDTRKVVCQYVDGKFVKIADPQYPAEAKYVIMCALGEVTLRKPFEECVAFPLKEQPNGFYWIMEDM